MGITKRLERRIRRVGGQNNKKIYNFLFEVSQRIDLYDIPNHTNSKLYTTPLLILPNSTQLTLHLAPLGRQQGRRHKHKPNIHS